MASPSLKNSTTEYVGHCCWGSPSNEQSLPQSSPQSSPESWPKSLPPSSPNNNCQNNHHNHYDCPELGTAQPHLPKNWKSLAKIHLTLDTIYGKSIEPKSLLKVSPNHIYRLVFKNVWHYIVAQYTRFSESCQDRLSNTIHAFCLFLFALSLAQPSLLLTCAMCKG